MKNSLNKVIINITWSIFGLSSHTVFADGTETLVTPSIKILTGVGVITSGTGLLTQPTTIDITSPDLADVKQVLLYWEGQLYSPAGDDKILFDDILVTGTLIRGSIIWYEDENTDEISPAKDRMTGEKSVLRNDNARVTLGFDIQCDLREPNNLQVNWPDGNKFHLVELIYAICTDDPKLNQKTPAVPFDTFTGEGTGRFNCVEGATINFIIVDQGEPAKSDTGWIQIFDKHEQEVLNVEGSMKYGNLQVHN